MTHNPKQNFNCDNDKCRDPKGETRTYPLGGGANLILCRACWIHENNYRASRGGQRSDFPLILWDTAPIYKCAEA